MFAFSKFWISSHRPPSCLVFGGLWPDALSVILPAPFGPYPGKPRRAPVGPMGHGQLKPYGPRTLRS